MRSVLPLLIAATLARADDSQCGSCLINNEAVFDGSALLSDLAAWCYSTQTCIAVDSVEAALSLFSGGACPDYTFDASTCLCRPDVYTDCGSCANAEHLGCIWMANASVTSNITWKTPLSSQASHVTTYDWKKGRCVKGSGFSPSGLETVVKYSSTLLEFEYNNVVKPKDWFWGQCKVTGPVMAGLAIGISVFGCCLCCLCCCMVARCARKRRALQEFNSSGLLR